MQIYQNLLPPSQNFSWYVNFTDFTISRAAVKISVKLYHLALFRTTYHVNV